MTPNRGAHPCPLCIRLSLGAELCPHLRGRLWSVDFGELSRAAARRDWREVKRWGPISPPNGGRQRLATGVSPWREAGPVGSPVRGGRTWGSARLSNASAAPCGGCAVGGALIHGLTPVATFYRPSGSTSRHSWLDAALSAPGACSGTPIGRDVEPVARLACPAVGHVGIRHGWASQPWHTSGRRRLAHRTPRSARNESDAKPALSGAKRGTALHSPRRRLALRLGRRGLLHIGTGATVGSSDRAGRDAARLGKPAVARTRESRPSSWPPRPASHRLVG